MTTTPAELMRRHQGDTATWRWELDDDPDGLLASWDPATLFGQVRAGTGATARLVATSAPADIADDTGGMSFAGTDFDATPAVLSWSVDLDGVAQGTYQLEVQVDIDGHTETIFSEPLVVLPQTAVAP